MPINKRNARRKSQRKIKVGLPATNKSSETNTDVRQDEDEVSEEKLVEPGSKNEERTVSNEDRADNKVDENENESGGDKDGVYPPPKETVPEAEPKLDPQSESKQEAEQELEPDKTKSVGDTDQLDVDDPISPTDTGLHDDVDPHFNTVPDNVLCRRCLCNKGNRLSPSCRLHIYCDKCYQDHRRNGDVFKCYLCNEVEDTDENYEIESSTTGVGCFQGVKLLISFSPPLLLSPRKITISPDGVILVIDIDRHKICTFGPDGNIRRAFSYLYGYLFQSGLCTNDENKLLLSIRDGTYNAISFYNIDGQFSYSAFLTNNYPSKIYIDVDSEGQVIIFYSPNNGSATVISKNKVVHQERHIPSEISKCNFTGMVINRLNDDMLLLDAKDKVHVLNSKGDLKTTFTFHHAAENAVTTNKVSKQDDADDGTTIPSIFCVDTNGCVIIADGLRRRLDLYMSDGTHISQLVEWHDHIPVDVAAAAMDNEVVVLVSDEARCLYSIQKYSYQVPSKYRQIPDVPFTAVQQTTCCVIA